MESAKGRRGGGFKLSKPRRIEVKPDKVEKKREEKGKCNALQWGGEILLSHFLRKILI